MSRGLPFLILLSLALGPWSSAWAQNQDRPENGTGNPDTQDEQNKDKPAGTGEETEGDPVEVSTGAFAYQKKLFEFPGREEPLSLALSYLSNAQGIETQTGSRWTHDFEERLVIQYTWLDPIEPYPGPADVAGYVPHENPEGGQNPQQGWGPTWDPVVLRPLRIDVYHFHDLRVDYYQRAAGDPTTWLPTSGQFTKLRSVNIQSGPYSLPRSFTLRNPDGSKTFFPQSLSEGGCGIYTIRAGITQDAKGNTISRDYVSVPKPSGCPGGEGLFYRRLSTVTDNYGRALTFSYDTAGWLHQIVDFTGRAVVLEHDTIGNITAIDLPRVSTLPPLPGVNSFTSRTEIEYTPLTPPFPHTKHNVKQIFAPTEVLAGGTGMVPYVVNTWDVTGERVTSQMVGGTNISGVPAGGQYTYLLEVFPAINYGGFFCTRQAMTIDPDGKAELRLFDSSFRPRLAYSFTGYIDPALAQNQSIASLVNVSPATPSVADSLNWSTPPSGSSSPPVGCHWTRYDYDQANNLVSLELTQDTRKEYIYDSASPDRFQRANLLVMKQVANDGSQALIQRAFLHDPLYNRTRREYDPRAFGNYTPPNGGAHTPERYAASTFFDYQEGQQSALQSEIDYWTIDMAQTTALSILSSHGLSVGPITFGSDLNLNGVVDGLGGNPVLRTRSVRTLVDPAASLPVFQTLVERVRCQYNSFGLLTRTVDPGGFRTDFTYYPADSTSNHPDVEPSSANDGGFLASVTRYSDAAATTSSVVKMGYDLVGRTVLIRNERGYDTTATYDELDRVVTTTDAAGTLRCVWHDANDNVLREALKYQTPLMNQTTGEPGRNLSAVRDIVTSKTYDILDNLVTNEVQNDATGSTSVVRYRYTKAGARVLTLYPEWSPGNGNVLATFFDEFGREWTSTQGGVTAQFSTHPSTADIPELAGIPVDVPNVTATKRTFHDLSRRARAEDEEGHATLYEYDAFNRLRKTIDPLGHYTLTQLDVAGNEILTERHDVVSAPDRLVARTALYHDERGQVFETRSDHFDQAGQAIGDGIATTRYKYDLRCLAVATADDNGQVWTTEYDGLGNQTRVTDPLGNFRTLGYDARSNTIYSELHEFESDAPTVEHVLRSWSFHDPLDRLTVSVDEGGLALRRSYDRAGRKVFESDARAAIVDVPLASLDSATHPQHGNLSGGPLVNRHGNTVWYEYDDQGYLTKTTRHQRVNGLGGNALLAGSAREIVTTRAYDLNGRLTAEADDSSNTTSYDYDWLNRLSRIDYADQTAATRTYYKTGRTRLSTDQNGTQVLYQFDAANRLVRETATPAPGVRGALYAEFEYDGANRMTLARNANATVTREYDSLSGLSAEVLDGKRTVIRHDATGKVTGYDYPGGRVLDLQYDALDRLRSVRDHGAPLALATWEYRGETTPKTQTFMNGVVGTTQQDHLRRPTDVAFVSGSTYLEHRTFGWDRQGNRTSRTDLMQSTARTFSHAYDSAARMVQSVRSGGGQPSLSISYDLDDIGNRNAVVNGPDAGTYTMDPQDRPVNQYTTTPLGARAYDSNGNLNSRGASTSLYYDYRDRLVEYLDSATGAHHFYAYDALGRRTLKIANFGTPGQVRTRYFYDGGLRICEERNAADAVVATYVNGSKLDDVVSMRRDVDGNGTPEDYYYHADDMGNVHAVTNSAGVVAERYEYLDYGQVVSPSSLSPLTSSALKNTRLFTGRELDWETGLYFYRSRYYDPRSGRFISRDLIGGWGDPANVGNAFSYCGSNPWSRVDPLGLCPGGMSPPMPPSVKGDCSHHGSSSGKQDKSGGRLSDAEYQKAKREANKAKAEELKAKIAGEVKKLEATAEALEKTTGKKNSVKVESGEDGSVTVTTEINGKKSSTTVQPSDGGAEATLKGSLAGDQARAEKALTAANPNAVVITIETTIRGGVQTGMKSSQTVVIDAKKGEVLSNKSTTGHTDFLVVDLPSRTSELTATSSKDSFDCTRTTITGRTSSWGFPAEIDYKINVDYVSATNDLVITGTHDSYPSYEITVNQSKVYDYKETNITGLFGSSDVKIPFLEIKR